jgi:hypothetical protein
MPDDDVYSLAFEESRRAITQQQAVHEALKTRAGTLLAVASLATSFLGGVALDKKVPQGAAWAPVLAFFIVGILIVAILWPWPGWVFRNSARVIIGDYIEADKPSNLSEMHRDLSLHMEQHFDSNEKRLEKLFWLYRIASIFLIIEIVLWLAILARS